MNCSSSLFITLITICVTTLFMQNGILRNIEGFTAPGLVFNIPSEWWHPKEYNSIDWLVSENLDRLSQPSCLSYNRGEPGVLNYNASTYRLWRF
jgi:hypothetical protein